MPQVSVCIPTYNSARFLGEAIESVLSQNYKDIELLVLDNASSDGTALLVKNIRDPRLNYIRNEINIGFSKNLNLGVKLAKGRYLQFLCADDYLYAGFLEKAVLILDNEPSVSFVHSAHDIVNSRGKVLERRVYPWNSRISGLEFVKTVLDWDMSGICFSSALMRREFLSKDKAINIALKNAVDYGIWVHLCTKGDVSYIKESLIAYRVHTGQSSHTLVPGEKLCIVEKYLKCAESFGLNDQQFKARILKSAVNSRVKEILLLRLKGASVSDLYSNLLQLFHKYRSYMKIYLAMVVIILCIVPRAIVKAIYAILRTIVIGNLKGKEMANESSSC